MASSSSQSAPAEATADPSPKTLTLVSSDGEFFVLPESAAVKSVTIQNLVEDGCADNPIPLPNVTAKVLAKVVEYLKIQADESLPADKKNKLNDELFSCNFKELCHYVVAANYLNIRDLMDFVCQKCADLMANKPVEWVRKTFRIEADFKEGEEEELRKEYFWAFEGVDSD